MSERKWEEGKIRCGEHGATAERQWSESRVAPLSPRCQLRSLWPWCHLTCALLPPANMLKTSKPSDPPRLSCDIAAAVRRCGKALPMVPGESEWMWSESKVNGEVRAKLTERGQGLGRWERGKRARWKWSKRASLTLTYSPSYSLLIRAPSALPGFARAHIAEQACFSLFSRPARPSLEVSRSVALLWGSCKDSPLHACCC